MSCASGWIWAWMASVRMRSLTCSSAKGTNCENLPETHAYLKELRRFIDQNYPGRILLCEANQWPEDVFPYFGDNDEFQMGFHFPIMPRIYMSIRKGDRTPLVWIMSRTPPISQYQPVVHIPAQPR